MKERWQRAALGFIGVVLLTFSGCSKIRSEVNFSLEYPYKVKVNTPLGDLGRIDMLVISDDEFKMGNITFTEDKENRSIKSLAIEKTSENTKENYKDNIIDVETIDKWRLQNNFRYEMYKDALTKSQPFYDAIEKIRNLDFTVYGKDISWQEDARVIYGEKCSLLRYRCTDELAIRICELLGVQTDITKLDKDYPVYITYYVGADKEIKYIGCEASKALEYICTLKGEEGIVNDMRIEIYVGEE